MDWEFADLALIGGDADENSILPARQKQGYAPLTLNKADPAFVVEAAFDRLVYPDLSGNLPYMDDDTKKIGPSFRAINFSDVAAALNQLAGGSWQDTFAVERFLSNDMTAFNDVPPEYYDMFSIGYKQLNTSLFARYSSLYLSAAQDLYFDLSKLTTHHRNVDSEYIEGPMSHSNPDRQYQFPGDSSPLCRYGWRWQRVDPSTGDDQQDKADRTTPIVFEDALGLHGTGLENQKAMTQHQFTLVYSYRRRGTTQWNSNSIFAVVFQFVDPSSWPIQVDGKTLIPFSQYAYGVYSNLVQRYVNPAFNTFFSKQLDFTSPFSPSRLDDDEYEFGSDLRFGWYFSMGDVFANRKIHTPLAQYYE